MYEKWIPPTGLHCGLVVTQGTHQLLRDVVDMLESPATTDFDMDRMADRINTFLRGQPTPPTPQDHKYGEAAKTAAERLKLPPFEYEERS